MNGNMTKLAAQAIKQLQAENEELSKQLDMFKAASATAFNLLNKGAVAAEDFEDTFNSLLSKDAEEIQVLEKAASFGSSGESLLGSVSDKPADDGTMDPLTRMLVEDL
tara:strand:- start:87 stop:410 length:324 start_codon:yes stop_codon:yes gene_type:complete